MSHRRLDKQMELTLRAILTKALTKDETEDKLVPFVLAGWFADDINGFPIIGLKRSGDRIIDLKQDELEGICARMPLFWENAELLSKETPLVERNEEDVADVKLDHVIMRVTTRDGQPLEILIQHDKELNIFLATLYRPKR